MNDTVKALGEKALQTWGSLALVALFGVLGGWAGFNYLVHKDKLEHKRFEARQIREARQVAIIENTCGTLQETAIGQLKVIEELMYRMDQRGEAWTPVIGQMKKYLEITLGPDALLSEHDQPRAKEKGR